MTKALTISLFLCLATCEAFQPYARVDRDGYAIGATGTWRGVAMTAANLLQPNADAPVYPK